MGQGPAGRLEEQSRQQAGQEATTSGLCWGDRGDQERHCAALLWMQDSWAIVTTCGKEQEKEPQGDSWFQAWVIERNKMPLTEIKVRKWFLKDLS